MKKPFNHFVITRFNLKQNIWKKDRTGAKVNNEEWLKDRYALFEKYCYPSLKNQSEQNFKWLVYFDEDTPEYFKLKNEQLHQKYSNFNAIYVKDFKTFEQELSNQIKKYIEVKKDYLITSRIDNDDCFHREAVKVIQNHFAEQNNTIIDLCNGLSLQTENGFKLSIKRNVQSGPFISLIERATVENANFITVYDREHNHWIGDAEFININSGYYWLQIIHGRNISNNLNNHLTFNKKYLKGYEFIGKIKFSFKYYLFIVLKKMKIIALFKFLKNG